MLESYISNAKRLKDISDGAGADVIIGNHTEYNDALNRFERTKARKAGEPQSVDRGQGRGPEVSHGSRGMREVLAGDRQRASVAQREVS